MGMTLCTKSGRAVDNAALFTLGEVTKLQGVSLNVVGCGVQVHSCLAPQIPCPQSTALITVISSISAYPQISMASNLHRSQI